MPDKQSILIVDDVKENIDVLVELLKGYDLVTALDGETALDIVQEEEIDLILLDIMMPNMDGFEVCSRLKENTQTSHIPIIFLSAKDKQQNIQLGFKVGAVDYITKPFHPDELLSRVNTHLKLRAYEKDLEKQVKEEIEKNKTKQELIYQQSKQAALGELLMHIAHQWKQPLASLGSINLLQQTKLDQDIPTSKEEHLQKLHKEEELILFMSNTVDTFRNFYTPSNKVEKFSLTQSLHKVLSISSATLNYNHINVDIVSHEKDQTHANENEFTQVILSIINNARDIFKLRKIKTPKIKILVENQKISISDNAGGVDASIIGEIFSPFKSTTGGNGVGLHIAKEIVEKNGGTIKVHNDNAGAIFTVGFSL